MHRSRPFVLADVPGNEQHDTDIVSFIVVSTAVYLIPLLSRIARRYTNPTSPVHFIVGGAGCDEMTASVSTGDDPAWVATADATYYGMGILNVFNVRCYFPFYFLIRMCVSVPAGVDVEVAVVR